MSKTSQKQIHKTLNKDNKRFFAVKQSKTASNSLKSIE